MNRLEGIKRPPLLMEIAADLLMNLIIEGRVTPETRINEVELSKKLNISRTPLREALFKLENAGFVTRSKNGGWAIASISIISMAEKYEMRMAIEGSAIIRSTEADRILVIPKFKKITDQMTKCAESMDYEKYRDLDFEFHRCFLSLHYNPYMENVYIETCKHMEWIRAITISPRLDIHKSINDHEKIVACLENNEAFEALKALYNHHERLFRKIAESMKGDDIKQ